MLEIVKLLPCVKHYEWGGHEYIPSLLGIEPTGEPFAELWLGSHRDGSALIPETGENFRDFLDRNPDFAGTGADVFPFLFKVLSMEMPLSIQCHPDREQAERAFASGNPNYTDPNGKAEMFYALEETELLCGFRKNPLHDEKTEDLHRYLSRFYPDDTAVDYAYRMNLVSLEPGEAIYVPPTVPHGYIKGCGIEVMTNSNNVLRLGLTHKRIDKDELYNVVMKKPFEPDLLGSYEDASGEQFFTPAGLKLCVMRDGFFQNRDAGARIVLCTSGRAVLNGDIEVSKGQAAAVAKGFNLLLDVEGEAFIADMI